MVKGRFACSARVCLQGEEARSGLPAVGALVKCEKQPHCTVFFVHTRAFTWFSAFAVRLTVGSCPQVSSSTRAL
eukprot:276226-Rhodomonas_salina.1